MSKKSFTETIDNYLKQADWIGESHPVAFGLRQAALELDAKWTTSLYAEYNKTIRYVESLRPVEIEETQTDPLLAPAVPALMTRA